MVRLDVEPRLTLSIEPDFRPVAGDRILIRERRFGQQIFDLFDPAAFVLSLHPHLLCFLKEQTEGDLVQEFFEAITANTDLHLGRRDVRYALHGNDEVFADINDNKGSVVRIRPQFVELIAVHQNLKVLGPGIAFVDLHDKTKAVAVSDREPV